MSGLRPNRWLILLLVWASYLNVYLSRLSIGPLAPFLKQAFGLSNTQVGSLVSAAAIVYTPTLIFGGWLVDRVGVRWMLSVGTLIAGICILALSTASSYPAMIVILAISGLGTGCIFPSAVKAIVLWFPLRERATAMGLNQTAVNVGGILGAVLLPIIALSMGWRFGFLFVGCFALLIFLCCSLFYRDPSAEADQPVRPGNAGGPIKKDPPYGSILQLLGKRDLWMLGLSGYFLGNLEFAVMTHLVLYLKEGLLFGAVTAGALLAMTEAAGAFGKPVSGMASDFLLRGRRKIVFLFMGGLAALLCLLLAVCGAVLGRFLYPTLALLGIVAIGWGGLYATMAGELGGRALAGLASGATAAVITLGAITGPPLFGYLVDRTQSFSAAWLAMAFCGLMAVLALTLIREQS